MDPADTVERLRPLLPAFGITRVANVTGLDHLGIPVVVVCRPNSRSLSVAQGKGLTLDSARASGLMESIECWHAERITLPLRLASLDEIRYTLPVVDCQRLPQLSVSRFHSRQRILWIEGFDVVQNEPMFVPYELVHLNMTLPLPDGSGCFPLSSNGLASGNHLLEAAVHAVCEVIERDAFALWDHGTDTARSSTRLDLETVDDDGCRTLLEKFDAGGMIVAAWDMTSDLGVPAFRCEIISRETDWVRPLYPSSGLGCHPSRNIALFRALSEAAQSRLTRISSSRDDVPRADYELTRHPDLLARLRAALLADRPTRRFHDVPTFESATFEADLLWLTERLRACGFDRAILVDLTQPGIDIAVVRAVIPGMEPKPSAAGYLAGPRALAVANLSVAQ